MKLLCFQARRFRWKSYAKSLEEVPDRDIEAEVAEALVVFIQAELSDGKEERRSSVARQALKHIKWLANKRGLKNIVIHPFAHLGGEDAPPSLAESLIADLGRRLAAAGYGLWTTPFGYSCEWDLSVYGESLAKNWKEIS
jgi:hypothetical protein